MKILSKSDAAETREWLKEMVHPVKLIHFTQEQKLTYGREAQQLLTDLTALSDKLSLEIRDFLQEGDLVEQYRIDKVPATVVRNGKDYGIRYYGLPAGYEFSSLLDSIVMVSRQDSRLTPKSRELLRQVTHPLHLEVFVTPT
jgi:alkyl hydroperoxide reductase subunit AhpF